MWLEVMEGSMIHLRFFLDFFTYYDHLWSFGLPFSKLMFPLFSKLLERRVLGPNVPYLVCVTKIIKCLPVGNFGILSIVVVVVVCSVPSAYTRSCSLEYLLKILYFIQNYANMT